MACFTAWLVRKASNAKSALDNATVFFILVMMAGMFAGAVLYLLDTTIMGINEALGLNMVLMTVGIVAVLRYWSTNDFDSKSLPENYSDEKELESSVIVLRAYVVYFLVMMASMTAIGVIYIINTAMTGLEEGLIVGNVIMTAGVADEIRYAFRHTGQKVSAAGVTRVSVRSRPARATLVSLILVGEFLMGWTFVLASGSALEGTGSQISVALSTFTSVAGSDWFLFTMVLEMIVSIYMLRAEFAKEFVGIVLFQSSAMFFVPTAIKDSSWSEFCISFECVAMLVLVVLAYECIHKNRISDKGVRQYLSIFLIFYFLTIAGLITWIIIGNSLLLLASIIGAMTLYFNAILAGDSSERTKTMNFSGVDVSRSSSIPER
jgi:hypothetical protein